MQSAPSGSIVSSAVRNYQVSIVRLAGRCTWEKHHTPWVLLEQQPAWMAAVWLNPMNIQKTASFLHCSNTRSILFPKDKYIYIYIFAGSRVGTKFSSQEVHGGLGGHLGLQSLPQHLVSHPAGPSSGCFLPSGSGSFGRTNLPPGVPIMCWTITKRSYSTTL